MPEWLGYANLALNLLILPLLAVLWNMSGAIAELRVHTKHTAEDTKVLRAELSDVRTQVTTAAVAAATAAATVVAALTEIRKPQ